MHRHVESGGKINQAKETREEWLEYQFHFDFVLEHGDREVYVETVIISDDPGDCEIQVVNIHFNER